MSKSYVVQGYTQNTNDIASCPRAHKTPEAVYWSLIAFIEQIYATARAPEGAARTAIRARYASDLGPAWGDETDDWIRESIILLDLSPGALEWWINLWPYNGPPAIP